MSRLVTPLLAVLLLLTSGLVFGLVQKNRSLVQQGRSVRVASPEFGKRAFVPSIRVGTLAGDSILLGHGSKDTRQVLLVFNTSCPYCEQTLPAWSALRESTRQWDAVSYVGIALDPARASQSYATAHELDFPIVSLTDEKTKSLYGLQRVPHTLVIGDEGRVLFSRIGAILEQANIDSILAAVSPRGT